MATAAWQQLDDDVEITLPRSIYASRLMRVFPIVAFLAILVCLLRFTSVRAQLGIPPSPVFLCVMGAMFLHNGWMAALAWLRPVVQVDEARVYAYMGFFGRRSELTRPQVLELMEAAQATRYWDWFRLPWFARRILGQLSRDGRKQLAIALQQHDVLGVFD